MNSHPNPPLPSDAAPFALTQRWLGRARCVVELAGELDLASAPLVKATLGGMLEHAGCREFVLDLDRLTYLDSTGLAVLVAFRRRLGSERRLAIAGASEEVLGLLSLTGLKGALDTFGGVDDALAYLDVAAGEDPEVALCPDAALVLGLAATALPFCDSLAAEADCWLRILLPSGTPALTGGSIETDAPIAHPGGMSRAAAAARGQRPVHQDRLDSVVAAAARIAGRRGATAIRTGDVLRAVTSVYGAVFEAALQTIEGTGAGLGPA